MIKIPADFKLLDIDGPFMQNYGPLYVKGSGKTSVYGLLAMPHHINLYGSLHGGVLAFLAETSMGLSCSESEEEYASMTTVSLSIDVISAASVDDWLESKIKVLKSGRRMRFAQSLILAKGAAIARASAVYSPAANRN